MISPELRDQLNEYLGSKISLDELADWLEPRAYDFLSTDPEGPDVQVIAEFELALTDIENGLQSEEDLKTVLRRLLRETEIIILPNPVADFVETGSMTPTQKSNQHNWAPTNAPLVPQRGYI